MSGYRLGVDIGGTFTDIVLLSEDGALHSKKILSTPDDYSRAIEEGVRELLDTTGIAHPRSAKSRTAPLWPPTPSSSARASRSH